MSSVLTINGQEKAFHNGLPDSLSDLLAQMKIDEATVVAELNGSIVERCCFARTKLEAGARIELIRFVGGG